MYVEGKKNENERVVYFSSRSLVDFGPSAGRCNPQGDPAYPHPIFSLGGHCVPSPSSTEGHV
jgi:hypothetical protein